MEVVEMIAPGFGYVAGSAGYILEFRDPEISYVDERSDQPSGERLRWVDADVLHVFLATPMHGDLIVTDLLGRIVATHRTEGEMAYINCSGLPSGVYFLYSSTRGSVGRFMKQ